MSLGTLSVRRARICWYLTTRSVWAGLHPLAWQWMSARDWFAALAAAGDRSRS